MLSLSNIVKVEKNKLNSDSAFLILLEITIPSVTEVIRIVNNNEDITWNSNTWQRFPFDIDEISESSNAELSEIQIKVSNVNNVVGQYIRQYDTHVKNNGFEAITATIYIVNTNDLDNPSPVYSTNVILSSSSINHMEVNFTLAARDLYRAMTPTYRMYPNNCRFSFKSTKCGYVGTATSCDKSLGTCKTLGNSNRYGGFPTIGNKSVSI